MCHGVTLLATLHSLFAAAERGFLVQQPQDLVAAAIRHFDEHAGNAGIAVRRERRLIRGRIKHGDRERGWIPPHRAGGPAEPFRRAFWLELAAGPREPSAPKADHPAHRMVPFASE